MTQTELVSLIVAEINSRSSLVTASVSKDGKLVLTTKKTGVTSATCSIYGPDEYANEDFSDGAPSYKLRVIGNEGDTYFQRWDSVKTVPLSKDDVNQVVDIASVMVESHINLDGRTDLNRGAMKLASLPMEDFGVINRVYSQSDNFAASRDFDESVNIDSYPSSITWTLPKSSNADIDEWTHITLANSLALDGDKGPVQALRRFQNSVLSFQDKGISEILYNSRTQLSTADGVPVEIANSGKVDGKRYITNKYGTTNKWSITEGKQALYFVDTLNKAFCGFSGNGIENLSARLNFGVWFRKHNSVEPWNPKDFNNIVSFYDKIHSDVYLVSGEDVSNESSLVYNELLGAFSSFYDYSYVPMMTNVGDRFISAKGHHLWWQNEGLYCNFFGTQYSYYAIHRVTPEPFGDKVWTNFEYRADVYRVLDEYGDESVDEPSLIDGGDINNFDGNYQENETFDHIKVWNEYQQTNNIAEATPIKKFRIWRYAIPRAIVTDTNKYGLDRIRNPWINIEFFKGVSSTDGTNQNLMQLHDITVKYFE